MLKCEMRRALRLRPVPAIPLRLRLMSTYRLTVTYLLTRSVSTNLSVPTGCCTYRCALDRRRRRCRRRRCRRQRSDIDEALTDIADRVHSVDCHVAMTTGRLVATADRWRSAGVETGDLQWRWRHILARLTADRDKPADGIDYVKFHRPRGIRAPVWRH